jgi:phospholipase/lecithinase/hemolysin
MKIIITVFALLFSTMISATSVNKLVVFGDSLSDNGNLYEYMKHQLPLSPPYFEGRFTNGPVWVELLMRSYYPTNVTAHLEDYAIGGAGVLEEDDSGLFTLREEVSTYLLTHNDKADADSMYIMWIGSNNYLALPDHPDEAISDVIVGIQNNLQRLVNKGAKHIMVVSVPDLGKIPGAQDFDAVDLLAYVSSQHNKILREKVSEFQAQYPHVQWLYFDISGLMGEIMEKPEAFGFTNVTGTCYEASLPQHVKNPVLKMVSTITAKNKKDACEGYLFFDPVHPSAFAHTIMAQRTKELFAKEHIEFE